MLGRSLTIWSRSLTWRLMAPVGLMLLLVALLALVSWGTRSRIHHAYETLIASQEVRTGLTEVRSLSRSLQRDALNLISETDPAELGILHGKYRARTAEMRSRLQALARNPAFEAGGQRAPYFSGQTIVVDRLTKVARLAEQGRIGDARALFRSEVRPHERAASKIADDLIAVQDRRVTELVAQGEALQREELVLSGLASLILFAAAAGLTLLIARRSILGPLSDIERAMTNVAEGETAGETPHIRRHDEIGRMARAIEVFRASVRERERLLAHEQHLQREVTEQERAHEQSRRRADTAAAERSAALARSAQLLESEVAEVLDALRSSSTQLSSTSHDLTEHSAIALQGLNAVRDAVGRAVGGATDIASATTQFTAAIDEASQRTRRSADLSAGAAKQSGVLAARMGRVQAVSGEIETVINLIAAIARQTNLLALNAGIEAARAGDAGQGFAIVASEVKQLARQTAHATDQITGQIADMQLAARDAADSLKLIEGMVADIAVESGLLASSIEEQAQSGRTINRNVTAAAADLDLIDGRIRDVADRASGVDSLAGHIENDAARLETMATAIGRALSAFFTDLEAVRASINGANTQPPR